MTMKIKLFRCPVHGCSWTRIVETLEGGLLGSDLGAHVLEKHPKLKHWRGFHKALEKARQ